MTRPLGDPLEGLRRFEAEVLLLRAIRDEAFLVVQAEHGAWIDDDGSLSRAIAGLRDALAAWQRGPVTVR